MRCLRIIPMFLDEANDFVEKWHRHSARTSNDGGKFAIGLEYEGELVGVAIVGRPVSRKLWEKEGRVGAELLRLCTSPEAPKGSGSKLYARARRIWQLMGGTKFHSYSCKHESGAIFRGAGIHEAAAEVKPAEWHRKGRPRKSQPVYKEAKVRWDEDLEEVPP